MKCVKCGAEWNSVDASEIYACPFCGELMREDIPFRQTIDTLQMLLYGDVSEDDDEGAGEEIYSQEQLLQERLEELLPCVLEERETVIEAAGLGITEILVQAAEEGEQRKMLLHQAYDKARAGGLEEEWAAAVLFVFGYPLGMDSREEFPLCGESGRHSVSIAPGEKIPGEQDSGRPLSELEELAEQGDAEATLELAERYAQGIGTERDYLQAAHWYGKAAQTGDAAAQYGLGFLYGHGMGVELDPEKAFAYYRESAEQGFAKAQFALGEMYYTGEGCEQSDAQAVYWMERAELDCQEPNLYLELAMIYHESEDESVYNPERAFTCAERAADAGSNVALNLLGTFCEEEEEYPQALEYYSRAAQAGVEIAFLSMGAYYQKGYGTEPDLQKAAEWYRQGADSGNMFCLNALAFCYKNGEGVPQNYEKAFDLFLKAAYAGNCAAEYNVGLAYYEGQGVPKNLYEARKWFRLSAQNEVGKALAALAFFTEKGIPDGSPDIDKALDLYLKAADAGDCGDAQWIVGNCRTFGLMNSYKDDLEGFSWYLEAAENGHATAQNNVAVAYVQGILVDQDYEQAVSWFEKAVAQQDPYALNNYGTMLVNGDGVKRDVARGFRMLSQSAALGNSDAKASLGICYFEGWGTQRDLDAALRWLSEAYAENGNAAAQQYLEKGFRQKNGQWVKRGVFGRVPDPTPLPPERPPVQAAGGCKKHCDFYAEDQSDEENGRSYCKKLQREVYTKSKCPYYHSGVQDLADLIIQMG